MKAVDHPALELADLLSVLEKGRGRVHFIGADRSSGQIAAGGRQLAAALAERAVLKERRTAVLLPNMPSILIAFQAALHLGLRLLLLDPRQEESLLEERLRDFRPDLLLTSNPAALFDKVLRLLPACPPDMPVVVKAITDLMPFPRNLLAPFLRGGGIATFPPEARFLRYRDFLKRARGRALPELLDPEPLEFLTEVIAPDVLLERVRRAAAPHREGERWLIAASLAQPDVLASVLCGLHKGADIILSPRLDRLSLDRIARQAGSEREIH